MCGGTNGNNYTENDFYTHDNAMIRREGRAMKRNETVRKITQRTIERIRYVQKWTIRTGFHKQARGAFYSHCFSSSTKVDPERRAQNLHRSSRQFAVNKSVIALVPPPQLFYHRLRTEPTFNFDHYTTTQVGQSFPAMGVKKWWRRWQTFTPQSA